MGIQNKVKIHSMGSYEVESKFKILFLTYEQQLDSWTEIPNLEIILKRATSIKKTQEWSPVSWHKYVNETLLAQTDDFQSLA